MIHDFQANMKSGYCKLNFFPNQIPCKLSIESLDCHFLITGFCSLPANIIPSLVYTTNKTREINTQGIVLIISKRYGLRAEALQRDVGVKYSEKLHDCLFITG